jgi:site-specific recombinase XerC
MESAPLVDCAGRPRSPATLPGYHRGRPPRNKGLRYPPDPPTVEEIIAVMRAAGDEPDGVRLRGVIVVLWRAGLRISEALALAESDLDGVRGAIQVRHGLCRIRHRPCYAEARVMPSCCFCCPCCPCSEQFRSRLGSALSVGSDQRLSRNASRLSVAR